jgi:integrase
MPRKPALFKWAARNGYYATIDGKRRRYGDTKKEAEQAFAAALAERALKTAMPGSCVYWIDQFLQHKKATAKKEKTYAYFEYLLNSFANFDLVIDRDIADLRKEHVEKWIASKKKWRGLKRGAVSAVRSFLKWLDENHGIRPFDRLLLKKTAVKNKAKTNWVSDRATHDLILAHVPDQQLRDVLNFLFSCGCRPNEMHMMRLRHLDLDHNRVVIPSDEVSDKKTLKEGKDRVLYPEPDGLAILKRLSADVTDPEQVLFLNSDGKPWTIWALNCRAQNLKSKLGGKRYSPYAWRHGFITRKLREGMAINILSNLVASSVATIQKHYDHFSDDADVLQQAVGTKV